MLFDISKFLFIYFLVLFAFANGLNQVNINICRIFLHINPQAPVAQKVADEVVFRRFRGEGVEFFKIGPH